MDLIELHEAVRAEVARRTPEGEEPYYTLEIRINSNQGRPAIEYTCYAAPAHERHKAFDSPEALLASLRGQPDEIPSGELSEVAS